MACGDSCLASRPEVLGMHTYTQLPACQHALLVLVQPHHDVREVVELGRLAQVPLRLLRHQRPPAAALGVLACR